MNKTIVNGNGGVMAGVITTSAVRAPIG